MSCSTKLCKKNELKFEDFEPTYELQKLPENYNLLVNIPAGFRKEDFRLQVDSSGELSVKGQKAPDNKCKRFSKIFQLPPDSNIEKIRGKFEGGVLTITMPRREKVILLENTEANAEKKDESTKTKEQTGTPEIKETASRINDDALNKRKQNNISGESNDNTMKKSGAEKIDRWREKISQEAKDWSYYATFDSMLDVINRNKKEIAVAVAAFSIGLMVARKLNSGK